VKNTVLSTGLAFFLLAMVLASTTVSVAGETQGFAMLGTSGAIHISSGGEIPEITINGTDFVANGERFIFRGVNVQFTGLHHPESGCQTISNATFDLYESWNVNVLRVWLNMEMASPSYGSWNQAFFDNLQRVVDLAETHNIYLFISSLHCYNLGPAFGGTGFPNWMFSGVSSQDSGWDILYKSVVLEDAAYPQIRTAIRDYYHRVVAIVKDRNIVMGYDIFNEPAYRSVPGYSKISASYFYEALSAYITEVDSFKPQAVEGNFIDDNYKPNIPNLFEAPHGYAGHTYSYSLSQMKGYFQNSVYWAHGSRWNVPMLNMEWFLGTQSEASNYGLTATDIANWYDTYLTAMEELGIGWAVLRCEASPSQLHWCGATVKNVLLDHFALNTLP